MPVEDNKQAVRRFYDDVVNGRNLDAVDELLTPDGVDDTFGSQSDVAVPAPPEDADGQGLRRLVMLTLGVQRIGSDHGVGEVQLLQQRPEPGDLVGRAVDVGLGQDPGGGVVHRRQQVHLHSAVVAAAAQGLAVDLDPLPPRRPDRRRRLGGRWGGRWSTATAARRRRASPTSTPTAPWRRCPDRTEVKRGSLSCVIVRPRTIELQGATAAHLARAMGAEPDRAARGSGTADQAGPLDGNHQRAMATDHSRDQLRPTCRSRQTITSRRAAKVCSASDSACRGGFGGSLMSLRRARRWRWGLRPGPDRLPGSSRRW
jgi:hypothetical protein